ncbi:MAG: hypothetical protein NC548_49820 [Lachnospiraceae bacterium]|nr:hypothetical protein [Lachnospiraceae bacterium]
MIETKVEVSKDLEKALKVLQQAKQRVANEKKKQNEKKRKAEKPLSHSPLFLMPKIKARAVRNDKSQSAAFICHKVYPYVPLPYWQNVGVAYG